MSPDRTLVSSLILKAIKRWGSHLSAVDKQAIRDSLSEVRDLDSGEVSVRIYTDSSVERDMRARSCAKEPMTIAWLRSELKPGDVFYDVGANVGPYSLYAAALTTGTAKIYAFEPSYLNFFQLCRNIILNDATESVIPLLVPLTDETRLDSFHYSNLVEGGALHSFRRALDYDGKSFQPLTSLGVVGLSLNDFARVPGVEPPTLLKIDVDGLEPYVLRGAREVLRDENLRSVLLEINDDLKSDAKEMLELLHRAGLEPIEKHQMNHQLHNYIFRRAVRSSSAPPRPEDVSVTYKR